MRQHGKAILRILLVEDNEGDVRLLRHMLQEAEDEQRFDVTSCDSLQACYALCRANEFDVILLDLGLPGTSGIETFRSLRNRVTTTPVVILSGVRDEKIASLAVSEGAEDYVPKQGITPRFISRAVRYAAERHELKARLQYLATHDPVTGAFNRHHFNQTIDGELARSKRYKHSIGFLMVDVNRFKEINDRFGHQTGDVVLRRVADVLLEQVRTVDMVVRYGGDEFLLVLPETGAGCEGVADRVRTVSVRVSDVPDAIEFPITLAIGASWWSPDDERSIEEVLAQADQQMYADKRRQENGA